MERQPKAALWDMDGTLVESNELHFLAWQATLAGAGYPFSEADHTAIQGLRNDAILQRVDPHLSAAQVAALSQEKEARYRAALQRVGLTPLPGVHRWLVYLRETGWRMAIASSGPHANIQAVLAATGLAPFFDVLVSGDDVQHSKPDPAIFRLAAAQLAIPPARCIVLEDASFGVAAARAAGMAVIAVGPQALSLGADRASINLDQLEPAVAEALLVAQPHRFG